MIALLLLGIVAAASAAPHFPPFRHPPPFHHDHHHDHYYRDDLFDTEKLWSDISRELAQIDEMLADLSKSFPSSVSNVGVVGNEYQITIFIPGFDEKDIVVKAREGILMIQAVHKAEDGSERNYLDIRTLPNNVKVTGSWTYSKNTLKIIFPLTEKSEETTNSVTEAVAVVTEAPEHSREEIETTPDNRDRGDADVGLESGRGDSDKNTEILTNEISGNTVEATTYAVDFNNEVEFVPVRYR